jgi:hypothetical protein
MKVAEPQQTGELTMFGHTAECGEYLNTICYIPFKRCLSFISNSLELKSQ